MVVKSKTPLHVIVHRLMEAARYESDDRMANILSRTADRFSRIGTPYAGHYDGPMTRTELKLVRQYIYE